MRPIIRAPASRFPPPPHPPLLFPALTLSTLYGRLLSCACLRPPPPPVSPPSPSPLSWVISLSYVCPSLCVCAPSLFVSDSFSWKIRDAYLAPLFFLDRRRRSAERGPGVKKTPPPHPLTVHSSPPDQCRGGRGGLPAKCTLTVQSERFIDRLTLFNVLRRVIKSHTGRHRLFFKKS